MLKQQYAKTMINCQGTSPGSIGERKPARSPTTRNKRDHQRSDTFYAIIVRERPMIIMNPKAAPADSKFVKTFSSHGSAFQWLNEYVKKSQPRVNEKEDSV